MRIFILSAATLLMAVPLAYGESSSTATVAEPSTTTASESGILGPNLLKDVYSDFLTTYHGPALDKFGPYSYNASGHIDPTALSGFDSEFHLAYMMDHESLVAIGPDLPFHYQPNLPGQTFVVGDVGLKAFNKKSIKTENFQLATNAYLEAPTSDAAKADNMVFAIETEPWLYYDIEGTHWRLGSWSDFRYRDGVTSGTNWKAWIGPYVSYRLTEKFALNLMYETEADHNVGDRAWGFSNAITDVQPGIVWNPAPGIKINPYVLIFPANHVATQTTSVGLVYYQQFL